MPEIHQSALVPYSPAQMFELVNDVARYPEFMPWCEAAVVVDSRPAVTRAALTVRKGRVHYSFTTDNALDPPRQLEMRLVDGPFKRLYGVWRFAENPFGTRVSLDLEFEFPNKIIGAALAPVFKAVTSSLVDSFKRRAEQLYGGR
jgi:ribosome-associated toxin RatA of RatAB toxin-antitoxin module